MFKIKLFATKKQEYVSILKKNTLADRSVQRLNKAYEQAAKQQRNSKSRD
jgi:hypothetical protein